MKRILLVTVLLLSYMTASSQHTYDIDFTQTKVMKVSKKTTNKVGHLVFDGKDRLTMNYSEPKGEYFIIEGNLVKVNLDGKKAEIDANKVKLVQLQRSTLLNCLSGNYEQAAIDNHAEKEITYKGDFMIVTLTVKGKVPKGGYSSVVLTYRKSDGLLTRMVLEEAVGAINTYELKQ